MSSTLDDHIRAALDRIRVSLSGQLEADLSASTSDIQRAVAEEHRLALIAANEQTAATIRSEAEQQLAAYAKNSHGKEKSSCEKAKSSHDKERTSSDSETSCREARPPRSPDSNVCSATCAMSSTCPPGSRRLAECARSARAPARGGQSGPRATSAGSRSAQAGTRTGESGSRAEPSGPRAQQAERATRRELQESIERAQSEARARPPRD